MEANPRKRRKLCADDETAGALALPDAIVLDILERLPIGDILRFRRVCRAWCAMIAGDTVFARAHLQRWRSEMVVVSPCSPGSGPFLKLYRYRESGGSERAAEPVSRVQLRSPKSYDRSIVHCDGVLVICSAAELLAWNPATGESVQLPRGKPSCCGAGIDRLGFCYDAAARALKVVRYYYRVHDVEAGAYSLGVEVLALGQGQGPPSWRPAARDPPCPIYGTPPASVGSAVYWAIDDRFLDGGPRSQPGVSTLLSFDVTTGEYNIVDGPPCRWRCQDVALGNVGGALCVVDTLKSLLGTVWLRTAGAWTRVLRARTRYILARLVPVGTCGRTGEMLLLAGRAMHHCCAGTGKARAVVDVRGQLQHSESSRRGGPIAKTLVFTYTPSLIKIGNNSTPTGRSDWKILRGDVPSELEATIVGRRNRRKWQGKKKKRPRDSRGKNREEISQSPSLVSGQRQVVQIGGTTGKVPLGGTTWRGLPLRRGDAGSLACRGPTW